MGSELILVTSVSFFTAFFGGILSFFSPCIFPVLPGFIGFLIGDTVSLKTKILKTVGFISGLAIVFTVLGALSGLFGSFLISFQGWISVIGGILIIIMGLSYIGLLKLPEFSIVKKQKNKKPSGFFSALLLGIFISFVWVPCVSPVLGSILIVAANSASLMNGVFLLLVYSLGMGIPLFFFAFFISALYKFVPKIMKYEKTIKIAGGVVLIFAGVLMATGLLNKLQAIL